MTAFGIGLRKVLGRRRWSVALQRAQHAVPLRRDWSAQV